MTVTKLMQKQQATIETPVIEEMYKSLKKHQVSTKVLLIVIEKQL